MLNLPVFNLIKNKKNIGIHFLQHMKILEVV